MTTEQQESPAVEQFEYQAEMKQLLHLIVHSLYTHPEIFLRELVSNASDALNKVRFRQLTDRNVASPDAPLSITVTLDAEAHTLTIEDTGIGMTRDDLIQRIGTVASSGTLAFLDEVKASGRPLDAQMIGQFGVGFYASFMVADEVVIETRHADPDAQGYRWHSDGTGRYTIEPIDRVQRGTRITLRLNDASHEFAQEARVREIVRKYSNFVDFPIYLGGVQVNTVKALWRKQKDAVTEDERNEFYKFITHDYDDPLGHLHVAVEGRVNFRALLFVPKHAPPGLFREEFERTLHLYASNVFIQDDCRSLLPEYLRFVRGVVDTEDLPLNVSREVTQSSPVMTRIRSVLTGKVLGMLEEWAEQDAATYDAFYDAFGMLFKSGVTMDADHRDRIVNLLRFESTRTEPGRTTALADYVGRMKEGQEAIYYLMGERRAVAERHPSLEYFKKNDVEVLFLIDPVDVFAIPLLGAYEGKPLQSIEKADLDLAPDADVQKEALAEDRVSHLLARFKATLGDRVEDVIASKRLVDSAATLVVGRQGLDTQVERMMKMMNEDFAGSSKILEVNPAHPLVKNLARLLDAGDRGDLLDQAILQLYEGALLIEGSLATPSDFVSRMTDLMVRATT